MPIEVHQFPCLSDNYGFLARDEATEEKILRFAMGGVGENG